MFHFPCLVTDLLMVTRSRSAISLWFKEGGIMVRGGTSMGYSMTVSMLIGLC